MGTKECKTCNHTLTAETLERIATPRECTPRVQAPKGEKKRELGWKVWPTPEVGKMFLPRGEELPDILAARRGVGL
jgi:hypothetical protein